ncbi:MAG TPA: HAMP domain-containing sensor histidine kinase, partial [Cyclobacteriaceae bacterium]|nr:HAMP domain-containing sensor histidine kinase [Cyclobacteriaceae bacterium]
MQHLISNLLDMNQIDQKKISIVPQKINLHDFLNRLEKNFDSQARKKNIELKIDKIEANINTDQHALSSVLENLISNALKFSPKGKSVYLKTYLEDGSVHFAVVDQGPGIAEDELPLLFKKFSRLTNKPTDNETSNGLGLAIAKELTDLLRGKILVTSRRGKGSTFTLVIPQ